MKSFHNFDFLKCVYIYIYIYALEISDFRFFLFFSFFSFFFFVFLSSVSCSSSFYYRSLLLLEFQYRRYNTVLSVPNNV